MCKLIRFSGIFLLFGLSAPVITGNGKLTNGIQSVNTYPAGNPEEAVTVTIIYDNYQYDANLRTDWGFACLIEYGGEKLLFDAGRNANIFRENMEKLGIRPEKIPFLFISHSHGDHTAGIPWITKSNSSIICYLPSTYATELEASCELPRNSNGYSSPAQLMGPFYTTGDGFEAFHEQGLVIKTSNGGVLITGCGHPGVVAMVTKARKTIGSRVHTVIGGLHLLRTPDVEVRNIAAQLKELGVERICPTHCTGDKAIALLRESFGKGYIEGGTGKQIIIK